MDADPVIPKLIRAALEKEPCLKISSTGTSMLPTIRPGQTIWIARVRPEEIRPGDIVLIQSSSSLVLHRLHRIEKRAGASPVFITSGDASGKLDTPCGAESILAKVIKIQEDPGGGFLNKFSHGFIRSYENLFAFPYRAYQRCTGKRWYGRLHRAVRKVSGGRPVAAPLMALFPIGSRAMALVPLRRDLRRKAASLHRFLPEGTLGKWRTTDSVEPILELWNRSIPHPSRESADNLRKELFAADLPGQNPFCFTFMRHGKTLGFISGLGSSIQAIAVDPGFRRKGIGSALLEALLKEARRRRVAQLVVSRNQGVFPDVEFSEYEPVVLFFSRWGFSIETTREGELVCLRFAL